MNNFLNRWKTDHTRDYLLEGLEQWFTEPSGRSLLQSQQAMFDREDITGSLFGYFLLQLSVSAKVQLVDNSRVQNRFCCHPLGDHSSARCDYEYLPFETESLDVVVVHHAHEFIENPHDLLREVQRVLIPNGRLIIAGFNPWSSMGLYSLIHRYIPLSFWRNHLITTRRMKDWLGLLGFETQQCYFGGHLPAFLGSSDSKRLDERLKRWPLGRYYMISAIKKEATLTPVRPKWKATTPHFSGLTPIKPSVSRRN